MVRVRIRRERSDSARHVDDAGVRRLSQQQHGLVDGDHAEDVTSQTARISSRDAVLALDSLAYSCMVKPPRRVFEIPALLTSRSRRPNSARMLSAASRRCLRMFDR